MKIYLVGGAVRDMLLGLEPKDSDYVVVGSSTEEMLALGYSQVGADFPVFLHPTSNEEYALARIERKVGAGYNGFSVMAGPEVTLEQDLSRRDLTINSMAIDESGNVIDPFGGQEDLKNKIIRHTSEAFAEDPVRVLRVARFASRYTDFSIHPDTVNMMRTIIKSGEFASLTPERVFAEFKKGLMEKEPFKMYQTLMLVGADKFLEEFFGISLSRLTSLQFAADNYEPLEVRFAIMANGFKTKDDFRRWTINADCEEISTLVNNELFNIIKYDELTSTEKVQLFNRMDLFRREERFIKVVKAIGYIARTMKEKEILISPKLSSEILESDVNKVLFVNGGAIAQSTLDKTKIKEAIFKARVDAIS